MKMMVSEDITHDDDQLSTKTNQDHEDDGIMEKESLFEDITHDDDQLSTKRLKIKKMMVSWKQKKILRKKRVYSKTSSVIFYILLVGVL